MSSGHVSNETCQYDTSVVRTVCVTHLVLQYMRLEGELGNTSRRTGIARNLKCLESTRVI